MYNIVYKEARGEENVYITERLQKEELFKDAKDLEQTC